MTVPIVWRFKEGRQRLVGGRCDSCGRAFYPATHGCPYCGSRRVKRVSLPREGRIVSYSIIYSATDDAKFEAPVVLALVDLGVARVIAEITDVDPSDVSEGMKVEAILRKVREEGESGVIVYALKFRPSLVNGD